MEVTAAPRCQSRRRGPGGWPLSATKSERIRSRPPRGSRRSGSGRTDRRASSRSIRGQSPWRCASSRRRSRWDRRRRAGPGPSRCPLGRDKPGLDVERERLDDPGETPSSPRVKVPIWAMVLSLCCIRPAPIAALMAIDGHRGGRPAAARRPKRSGRTAGRDFFVSRGMRAPGSPRDLARGVVGQGKKVAGRPLRDRGRGAPATEPWR